MPAVFTHTLALALRLIDTATGAAVTARPISLLRDGVPVQPMVKGGCLLLLGSGGADFDLRVETEEYEPMSVRVAYAALDPALPQLDLHLIPGRAYRARHPCLTLEGRLPGIADLCAVPWGQTSCFIRSFDPEKRLLTLRNPHALELSRVHYALADPEGECFEPFVILRRLSDCQFLTDRALTTRFTDFFPICPVVFGMTAPDGAYRLRVRDDATDARWLVRWTTAAGPPRFQSIDFRRPETLDSRKVKSRTKS